MSGETETVWNSPSVILHAKN